MGGIGTLACRPPSADAVRCGRCNATYEDSAWATITLIELVSPERLPRTFAAGPRTRRKGKGEISMSTLENVQVVKECFAEMGSGDEQGSLALVAKDIEWIIPGEDWPLAGTHRGHAGLADVLQKASEVKTSYAEPPEFVAQGDRVLVVGFATRERIKARNRTFGDHWVFAIAVRNGKLTNIREYIDTQALARASEMAASPRPCTHRDRYHTKRFVKSVV